MVNNISMHNYITNDSLSVNDNVKVQKTSQDNNDIDVVYDSDSGDSSIFNNFGVIAHRGYSDVAPENTIPAFIAAAENGFTTVECDIEWTKDNVPVILHDATINRTARKENGWGFFFRHKCSDYTYDELLKFDFGIWKGEEYKGTKIPSFSELLDCSDEYGLNLYVEIKETSDFDKEKAQILADTVKEAGLEDKVTWISFNADYLKTMSELMPESRLGYLSKKTPTEDTISVLENLKNDTNEVFLDVKGSKMTEKASKMLEQSGFEFEAWTVDDSDDLDDLYSYDCKGITTNTLTEDAVEEYINSIEK